MADGSMDTTFQRNNGGVPSNPAPAQAPASTLSPEQIAAMNAQTQGYQDQTKALQAQIAAQNAANAAGPQLEYNPLKDDGTLKSEFSLPGASTYTAALQKQQELMGAQGRDSAAVQGQTAVNQANENLAMRGGSGSANRALNEATGIKTAMNAQQNASQTAANNTASIGVQGANAQMGIDKTNLQNQFTAAQNVNAFNLDKYNQNMAVKAADTQAKATESAANSGGK